MVEKKVRLKNGSQKDAMVEHTPLPSLKKSTVQRDKNRDNLGSRSMPRKSNRGLKQIVHNNRVGQ